MPYFIVYHHKKWLNPAFYLIKSKVKAKNQLELEHKFEMNFGLDHEVISCTELVEGDNGADLLV